MTKVIVTAPSIEIVYFYSDNCLEYAEYNINGETGKVDKWLFSGVALQQTPEEFANSFKSASAIVLDE